MNIHLNFDALENLRSFRIKPDSGGVYKDENNGKYVGYVYTSNCVFDTDEFDSFGKAFDYVKKYNLKPKTK